MLNRILQILKPFVQAGEQRRRLIMTVIGVSVLGFGVSLCRMAAFGVDPFQSFCYGIYRAIPGVPRGTLYVIINAVLLIAVLIYNRHYIGLGTLINMFLLGYVADGGEKLLRLVIPDASTVVPLGFLPCSLGQIGFLIAGIIVLCLSSALYIAADLGVSTYDAIALEFEKRGIAPYRIMRICTDVVCVAIGWVLGEVPGVCTIITAFMLGPLTSFFMDKIAKPLRYGRKTASK